MKKNTEITVKSVRRENQAAQALRGLASGMEGFILPDEAPELPMEEINNALVESMEE